MPKILIVEDNEENRDSLTRRLKRRGFEVVHAVNGREGVAAANDEKPTLILMDMNMPEIDGWEATKLIKANAALQDVPIVALTAHAMAGDRDRALQAGCADYHTKPVDFERLLTQIETLLKQSPARS